MVQKIMAVIGWTIGALVSGLTSFFLFAVWQGTKMADVELTWQNFCHPTLESAITWKTVFGTVFYGGICLWCVWRAVRRARTR